MPITRSDVGAWLVKGDPKRFKYDEYLAARVIGRGDAVSGKWSVGTTYRNALMREGDPFVVYMGGSVAAAVEIGIVSGPLFEDRWEEDFTAEESDREKLRTSVPYMGVVLSDPVPRSDFKADARLASAEVIRVSQLTNPSFLTPAETQALSTHIAPRDLRIAGWNGRAGVAPNAR